MHYFKRNIGDYHKKAGRLSILEHGVYTLLMDACYDRETFPTEEEAIDWCWARSDEEVAAVKFVLSKFFTLEDGRYVQQRIADEVAKYHARAETNRQVALEREASRKAKREQVEHESCTNHHLTTNQEPLTKNQETQSQNLCAANAAPPPAEPEPEKAKRGKRLPENWSLPDDWFDWAMSDRPELGEAGIRREAEKFADHWHAATKNAAKLDWQATWRNWVRNARADRNVSQFPAKSRFNNLPKINAAELNARADENKRLGVVRANF